MTEFSKHFKHVTREFEICEREGAGLFSPIRTARKEPFVISMPLPNATGTLRLGQEEPTKCHSKKS